MRKRDLVVIAVCAISLILVPVFVKGNYEESDNFQSVGILWIIDHEECINCGACLEETDCIVEDSENDRVCFNECDQCTDGFHSCGGRYAYVSSGCDEEIEKAADVCPVECISYQLIY